MKRAANFEYADIVDILNNISSMTSFASGLASRWSSWNIRFTPSKYFQCVGDVQKQINEVKIKTSLSPNAFRTLAPELDIVDEKFIDETLRILEGLRYERKVCLSVITDLIDSGTCTHFRKYYSNSGKLRVMDFERQVSFGQLKRELCYLAKNMRNRPKIQTAITDEEEKMIKNLPYRFISNLDLNCLIYDERFIGSLLTLLFEKWKATSEFYIVLFQVCYTCYCLNRAGISHNNVNTLTVLVDKLKQTVSLGYNVDGTQYIFENANVMVVVENFEQSYCKGFGPNKATDKNDIVGIRDFASFLKSCTKDGKLLHLIGVTEEDLQRIQASYRDRIISTIPIEAFLNPNITYPDVLNNIYTVYKNISKDEELKPVSGSSLQVFDSSKFIEL